MEQTNKKFSLTKAFYKAIHSTGTAIGKVTRSIGEGLCSVYSAATGDSRLKKMGIDTNTDGREALDFFGIAASGISGVILLAPIIIAGAPLTLLAIPPALLLGISIIPQQLDSLYKAGQHAALEEADIPQPKSLESPKPEASSVPRLDEASVPQLDI